MEPSDAFTTCPPHTHLAARGLTPVSTLLQFAAFGLSVQALVSFAAAEAAAQSFAPVLRLTDSNSGGSVVGDSNGDGLPDVAVANGGNAFGGTVGVYLGKGDGSFQPRVSYPALVNTLTIDAADFNADGKLDLAVANYSFDAAAGVLLGNGDGTFDTPRLHGEAGARWLNLGYLRRDPHDPPDTDYAGHQFWLGKLDEFHGDFIRAEMVKAFISSDEYRKRFGQ